MIKDILSSLGITEQGSISDDGNYVIDISDSNEYSRIFSKLDKSSDILENEDATVVTFHNAIQAFENDDISIDLIADFDLDTYKLVAKEK